MNSVCVIGLGHVGLPTAVLLARSGLQVIGVDTDASVCAGIASGKSSLRETGLDVLLQEVIENASLRLSATPENADVFLIAVPTPLTEDKHADLGQVLQALDSLIPALQPGNLVLIESTCPPGTCRDHIAPRLQSAGFTPGEHIHLAYCPERITPGNLLQELVENDRIIGGWDAASAEKAKQLYEYFAKGELRITDTTTAEMVKVVENTYRDVNIAFANETALLCERLGLDIQEVTQLANRHPRVNLHQAGPGVGGHCVAVDPWFLAALEPEKTELAQMARHINDAMPQHVIRAVCELLEGVDTPKVAVLGLAYKADVGDIRESPALTVVHGLLEQGITVAIHDPYVKDAPLPLESLDACIDQADLLLLLTDHATFGDLDPATLAPAMRSPRLYDTRNALDRTPWEQAGFLVRRLGQGQTILEL